MSYDLYTHEKPFLAIDGTECKTLPEVYDYNANFWNNAICLEPENPMKQIMTHYFIIARDQLSGLAMDVADWLAYYESFKLALENGFLSEQFSKYYGNLLLKARVLTDEKRDEVIYTKTISELLAILKKLNLANAEEPKK